MQLRVQLSNSGHTLKFLVPNHYWKIMSGWSNYSCTVISQKMIEKEMGYRGSKLITNFYIPTSQNKLVIVKEQRVDGSYVPSNWTLRCTLTGFVRNYQIKYFSKQLNLNKKYFSTLNTQPKLNPWLWTSRRWKFI